MNIEQISIPLIFIIEFLLLLFISLIIFYFYRRNIHLHESSMIKSFEKFFHKLSSLENVKDVIGRFATQMISHEQLSKSAFAIICKNGKISNKLGFNVPNGCLDNIVINKTTHLLLSSHKHAFLYSPTLLKEMNVDIETKGDYLLITPFQLDKDQFLFLVFFKKSKLTTVQRSMINFYCSQLSFKFRELLLEEASLRYKKNIGSIERSFVNVLEKSPSGLVIVNKKHEVVYTNIYAKKVLNLSSEKSPAFEKFIKDDSAKKAFNEMLDKLFSEDTTLEVRERFVIKTNVKKKRIFDVFAYPIKTDLKTFHVVFMIRDRTKQYTLEKELRMTQELANKELSQKVKHATAELVNTNKELRRASKLKSEFVSTISHELRTPLTSIKGYISLLHSEKLGELKPDQKESLNIVMQESNRLADLINDILDFSRLDSAKTTLNIKHQNLNDTVQYVVDSYRLEAKNKGIKLVCKKNPHCSNVPYDESKMKQVLINLVNNSIKFSSSDSEISIILKKESHFCYILVSDQGKGIPKENLKTIFDPFYQLQAHQTEEIKGTGLGLAIVKNIIDLHKGTISVESEVDRGTTFTIALPLSSNENKF